ncbi:hypothetical protein OG521_30390 [Streptomyces sp. NBC_01463]|uniref:hypothetical protein n=1 Tax=unclassified Streptomyces TaxID=2593676 RepID=UPI002552C1D3|nr:hypothetical protein [Streptomyces sp. RTGN2]WSU58089.1 hypothetical protein OG450_09590 [Streptomyces sp. NBC_01104]
MKNEELPGRLREAAEAHRPDRERMLARVGRGMAGARPPARGVVRPPRAATPWLRVAGATAAVCGVLALGAFAVTSAGDGGPRGERLAAAPSSPAHPSSPAAAGSPPAPPGSLRTADGPLWTDGVVDPHSNAYWAQSNVTLRTDEPLSSLTVELRIALTGGVNSTGSWRSLPEEDFTVSATEDGGYLVYRWALKPGRTVPAGTYTFAGQYNHAEGGRDATGDYLTAHAVRVSGERASVGDRFGSGH